MLFIRSAMLAMVALVSACANQTPPPPPPISAEQFAAYRLADVTIDTSEAEISWPQAERDFAASKGIEIQSSSSSAFGERADYQVSDDDRAAFTAYDDAIKSEEAREFYRQRVSDVMKPRFTEALAPAFTGDQPLNLTVALKQFTIRSSAAVAFGGDEGTAGSFIFAEPDSTEVIASSPELTFVSQNGAVVPAAGGLAGLAISLAVSAAVNIASDAAVDSAEHISENYAQTSRTWLQLEPYEFAE